jgi:hypothetical protein
VASPSADPSSAAPLSGAHWGHRKPNGSTASPDSRESGGDGQSYVNRRVKKEFENDDGQFVYFKGKVTEFIARDAGAGGQRSDWWKVVYEDGDREELELHELKTVLV